MDKIVFFRPPETSVFLEDAAISNEPIRIVPFRGKVPNLSMYHLGALAKEALQEKQLDMKVEYYDYATSNAQNISDYLPGNNDILKYGQGTIRKKLQGESLEKLEPIIKDAKALFLSSPFASGSIAIRQTAELSKKINPDIIIVAGGRDVQYRPKWYLENGINIAAVGRAEGVVNNIIDMIANKNIHSGEGYLLREEENARGHLRFPKDMDLTKLVLPDFQEDILHTYTESCEGYLPEGIKGPTMWYTTSVGCISNCDFCPSASHAYKRTSEENFSALLHHYKRHGIETLLSAEDNFLARLRVNKKDGEGEIKGLLDEMYQQGFNHEFVNGLEVDLLLDEKQHPRTDLINALFGEKGAFRMYFPVESFNPRRRELYRKLTSLEKMYELIDAICDTGIKEMVFNTILFHDTTPEDVKTLRKEMNRFTKHMSMKNVRYTLPVFHELPLPGSKNYASIEPLSIGIEQHPELYTVMSNPVNGTHYSAPELFKIKYDLMNEFDPEGLRSWVTEGRYKLT